MKKWRLNRAYFPALVALLVMAVSAVAILANEATRALDVELQPDGAGYRPEVPMRAYCDYSPSPSLAGAPMDGVTLTPESLDVWLSPGEILVEDKILHLPEHPLPSKADVLICFDLTGSMTEELANVKANAIDIMEGVRDMVPDTYFGVISHTDYPGTYSGCDYTALYGDPRDGDFPYALNISLTSNLTAVHNAINALALGDGSDAPECYSRALYATYTDRGIGWRPEARKIVLQWGDNVPHDCEYGYCIGLSGTSGPDPGPDAVANNGDDLMIMEVIGAMANRDITLISMYSGYSSTRLHLWNCLAGKTGGEAFEVNPDGTIAGGVSITDYVVDAIGDQFKEIGYLTLETCDEDFAEWLVDVAPPAYTDVVLDSPQDLPFSITIQVPEGTEPGDYCFEICAVGDGAVYAKQYICVHVRPDECFDLDIGDASGDAGDMVRVPVSIQDATGWGIRLMDMDICWCGPESSMLTLAGFAAGPVLEENKLEVNATQTGRNCLSFVGKAEGPLVGGGVVFYLDFTIDEQAGPCDCCDIVFASVYFDNSEFIEICPEDGSVCVEHCHVEGYLHNWYCEEHQGGPVLTDPLADAEVLLYLDCDEPDLGGVSTTTDEDGYYLFDCLARLPEEPRLDRSWCQYCVEPGEVAVPEGWITAYDASLILQYGHEADLLLKCPFEVDETTYLPQRVAADVDCETYITQADAELVLEHVVGLIPSFPGCPDWVWVPPVQCTDACPDRLDFIGVLKGDVSGPMPEPVLDPAHLQIGVPRHYYDGDDWYVEIPIKVKQATDVFSLQFALLYNANKLIVHSVVPVGLASGYACAYNDLGGRVEIALAGYDSFSGNGQVVMVTFLKNGRRVPVAHPQVCLEDAMFNEGDPPAIIDGHSYDGEIVRFGLGPITPNPFSESTVISYATPRASGVALTIYNVRGQMVREVFRGEVPAGIHQVTWDGCDGAGTRVARGVYFCKMEAGGFGATEKLVLLK